MEFVQGKFLIITKLLAGFSVSNKALAFQKMYSGTFQPEK